MDKNKLNEITLKVIADETMDAWSLDANDCRNIVMEVNGIMVLWEAVIAELKKEDAEYEASKPKRNVDGESTVDC